MKSTLLPWLLVTIFFSNLSQAQSISNVYVFGEKDSQANISCRASYDSSVAAVKAALRYNRISLADSPNNDFNIYVNINNFEVDSSSCAIAISMEVSFYDIAFIPKTKKSSFLRTVLCHRGSSGFLRKSSMQSDINTTLKGYVDECVTEIEALLKK